MWSFEEEPFMQSIDWTLVGWMVVEGTILCSVLFLVLYIRKVFKRMGRNADPVWNPAGLEGWLAESKSLCETLSRNLEEKKEITRGLVRQLDAKIDGFNESLTRIEEREGGIKELYPQVVEMAQKGCDAAQIARWFKLSRGEIQLILDLQSYGEKADRMELR
jgi:hypothetical protein